MTDRGGWNQDEEDNMKADRRHELKENDLAHALEVARNYLNEHGGRIGLVVVVVLAVIAVVGIAARSRAVALEDAWERKNDLVFDNVEDGKKSLEMLRTLTSEMADSGFALAGLLDQGRHALGLESPREGFILVGLVDQGRHALRLAQQVDDPPDLELNEIAHEAFKQLLARFGENPLAIGAAHCGLATVEENSFALDGDLAHRERARQHLQAVVDNPALHGLPFHRIAVERTRTLDRVFSVVRFESAPPEQEQVEPAPAAVAPVRISEDQVPPHILQKVQVKEDGTLEPLETKPE